MTLHSDDPSAVLEGILEQAVMLGASDIHLDPVPNGMVARIRVDGLLYTLGQFEKVSPESVTSLIKVSAKMDIVEKRMPQDGHFEFLYPQSNQVVGFRVSTTPTVYGEAVVLRLLNRNSVAETMDNIGFTPEQLETVKKIIYSPYGIIIITGPMGSGKTTLLYLFLRTLNNTQLNIITLEDPIEYQIPDFRQMQVNETIGWSFAKGMRAIVRQDPDIIMLGEIRDSETAMMTFQAALTGRLVFSTFHTFDIPGIIIRLIEMGIPRSVVSHALTGVISSRLVRKICSACAEDVPAIESDLKLLGLPAGEYMLKRGKGCEVCHGTGYAGRTGLFEVVHFDDEIKENVMQSNPAVSLRDLLKTKVHPAMRQIAVDKVMQGITTPAEFMRVIGL